MEEKDIEPKEYLFQTIIDIANNPVLTKLLEHSRGNGIIFNHYYDIKSIIYEIFFKNPRLILSLLFIKASITYEFLDIFYEKGIEITNILGEEKTLEIVDSIEVNNLRFFEKLNTIIINNLELSNKITKLVEMNQEYKIICSILLLIFIPGIICVEIFGYLFNLNPEGTLWSIIFSPPLLLFSTIAIISLLFIAKFDCFQYPYFN